MTSDKWSRPAREADTRAFRTDIQGLRAIAVGLVVLYHFGVPGLSGGFVGVDVFFVISGFLITGHLMTSLRREGSIRFAQFYARRARRILPASFVVILLTILGAFFLVPPLQLPSVMRDAMATALYVPNVLFAAQGTNYLAETAPSVFQQYWSLGVEEQFYLLWPLVLVLAYWVVRRSERRLIWAVLTLTTISFVLCIALVSSQQPWAFFSLPTRAWELGVGALTACLVQQAPRWMSGTIAAVSGWVGIGAIVSAGILLSGATLFPSWSTLLPVLGTALVILAGRAPVPGGPGAVLSVRPAQFIGKISYSLYLIHWPLLVLPAAAFGQGNAVPWPVTAILGLASVPTAYILYRYVERPMIALPQLSKARPRRTLLLTGAASIVIAALAATSSVAVSSQPLDAGVRAAGIAPSAHPSGTSEVPSNLSPSLRSADHDVPALYADGCHRDFPSTDASGCTFGKDENAPLVALFGDSHAAQWFPALEELASTGTIRLATYTKSSCPSVSIGLERNNAPYVECDVWRNKVIESLKATPPAVTVLANYGTASMDGGNANFDNRWAYGLTTTINALSPTQRVVVLADTPAMNGTPAVCLSAHLTNTSSCDRARDAAVPAPINKQAALRSGATYIDLTDYFCGTASCPTVIGDTLVYRDEHHITATFSRILSGVIGQALFPVIASAAKTQ